MYKIKVNDRFDFETETVKGITILNGNQITPDVVQIDKHNYHIIDKHKSYNVEVVVFNPAEKTAQLKVNGNTYFLKAKDQFDTLLEQLGMSSLSAAKISDIKAPMPGLVLKLLVTEGQEIKKGDNLLILEAMKMENIIKAPADQKIRSIKIRAGEKVEKNQILLSF